MKQELVDHQKSLMKTNKKLTFYSIFKTENKKAEFLDYIKNPIHKKIINKFRLGNHKLRIETGYRLRNSYETRLAMQWAQIAY